MLRRKAKAILLDCLKFGEREAVPKRQ